MNDESETSEPKKRTHLSVSPTNHAFSPYSDNSDYSDENNDTGTGNRNRKPMQFFDIDVEEEENVDHETTVHDQLPSVEEITNTAHFAASSKRKTRNQKLWYIFWGVLIVGVFLLGNMRVKKRKEYQAAVILGSTTLRVSHADAFFDSKSPQSMALRWMLHEDPLQLPLPVTRRDPFVQRYVIAVLVFALTTPNTKTSLVSSRKNMYNTRKVFGLLSGDHECDWNSKWNQVIDNDDDVDRIHDSEGTQEGVTMGIICGFGDETNKSSSAGGVSDYSETVTGIFFRKSGLHGELPPELEILDHLTRVDLANNQITGTIPPMPRLKDLSLADNQLSGYLPDHFSEMTYLQSLSLSENSLEGSLPHKFAALTDLEILALNGNQLTGGLEELYSLKKLEELYLAHNKFDHELTHSSFEELSSLKVIDVKDNRLSGPLPNSLWKLTHLEVMDFHKNAIDGHINNVIVEDHPLKYLDVSNNLLGGGLPTSINNLSQLTHLDLSYNRLDSRIPKDHLVNMTKIRTLLLTEDDDMGAGPLPDWLRGMTDLQHLSFRLATRTGTIPTWFGELTRLELLDLDWNRISGTIPTELGLLTSLKYLMLNRNLLTGTVPTQISYLPHLKLLMLDTNDLDYAVLIGDDEVCDAKGTSAGRIDDLIADCGRLEDGLLMEQEVECPCCTSCCWDSAQWCNMKDWIAEVAEEEYRSSYGRYKYDLGDDDFIPVP